MQPSASPSAAAKSRQVSGVGLDPDQEEEFIDRGNNPYCPGCPNTQNWTYAHYAIWVCAVVGSLFQLLFLLVHFVFALATIEREHVSAVYLVAFMQFFTHIVVCMLGVILVAKRRWALVPKRQYFVYFRNAVCKSFFVCNSFFMSRPCLLPN